MTERKVSRFRDFLTLPRPYPLLVPGLLLEFLEIRGSPLQPSNPVNCRCKPSLYIVPLCFLTNKPKQSDKKDK